MKPPHYSGLIITGASGAGKTTLTRILKDACKQDGVSFPIRLTTRGVRTDDRPDEQRSLTRAEFQNLVSTNALWIWWTKPVPGGNDAHYGFQRPPLTRSVLAGNSDLLTHPELVRPDARILKDFRPVLVTCDPLIRMERLLSRDPHLIEREAEYRKRAEDDTTRLAAHASLIIDTTGGVDPAVVTQLREYLLEAA